MKTLILTDNAQALEIARELNAVYGEIDIFQSPDGRLAGVSGLNVRTQVAEIREKYGLVISFHCTQLFPPELISAVRCINVHPGFNPFNRGWFPHVFSIINGKKAGATIHEIDEQLDHGPIIAQREYEIKSWDTSESAYRNIMKIEMDLLREHFPSIRKGSYRSWRPHEEGNINYKSDFKRLKRIDLDNYGCFRDLLNRLRALTHANYKNAYFIDESGQMVFIRLILEPGGSERALRDRDA